MKKAIHYPTELPIVSHREEIISAIRENPVVIVAGDTGSGKTTQIPKMCLEAGLGREKRIGCTQPRRIAAISVAARVAEELGAEGPGLVGYKIRFRDRTSRATRIKFMTDGVLLAEAQTDRRLSSYNTLIIDEAHERSLNIDFLLGLLKRLLVRRRDLKVIITSATIDTEKFSKNFDNAPVIEVSGRTYPVEVRYRPLDSDKEEAGEQTYVDRAVQAVLDLREEDRSGDVLIFMPTERDIRETVEALREALKFSRKAGAKGGGRPSDAVILPLFGRLSPAEQSRIFQATKGQKVVVATNIAETSLTVPGIRYVVDTGLARIAVYNPRARTRKLPIVPVSRAACDQRKGRCGRLGPGVCIRLYSEDDYDNRPEYTPPEILRANLAEVILRMIAAKLGDPGSFPFIDPPSARALKDGYALLGELGAIDRQRRLTGRGRLMARLPLDPRVARMIIEARDNNVLREVAVIAAALSIQDPRIRPAEKEKEADKAHGKFATSASDFLFYLKLWDTYHATLEKIKSQSRMRKFCKSHFLSYQRLREWLDIHEQITDILAAEKGFAPNLVAGDADAVHRAILSGNLRNIGMKKAKNIYQGGGGREITIFPGSGQYNKAGQWIMAAELVETAKLYARTVAAIKPEWLEPLAGDLCRSSYSDPHWEKKQGRVVALEKVTLFGLVIVAGRKVNFGRLKPEEARRIFIDAALVEGELQGDHAFLKHNQQLVASLQDMEDRTRRRDILVDDQTLFRFYEERLDPLVWDQAGLNRMLKKQGGDDFLKMRQEDILYRAPETAHLEQFPRELTVNGMTLQLSYRFEPGAEEDGVSAFIPVNLAPHLRPEIFEWLVPGLLLEKITALLKGLPKALRKQLIPIPRTAADVVKQLKSYQGSFYRALEQVIHDTYRLRIEPRHWQKAALAPHLRFRFCLIDSQGESIKTGRELSGLLQAGTPAALPSDKIAALQKEWERDGVGPEDLQPLPRRIPITDRAGALTGYVFPGLLSDKDGRLHVRLFVDELECRERTKQGLLHLYSGLFRKHLKALKKDFAVPRSRWPLYEGLGSHEQVNEELLRFILSEVFDIRSGQVPSRETFRARAARVREKGLFVLGKEVMDLVVSVLTERRNTLGCINTFADAGKTAGRPQKSVQEYRRQVAALVPPDFLQQFDRQRLEALPRYLKALRVRLERARLAPAKDAVKAGQVAPYEERLRECFKDKDMSAEKRRLLEEFREMVEEFKVSLFAQELKTAFPVSAKRLEKKWREMESGCL